MENNVNSVISRKAVRGWLDRYSELHRSCGAQLTDMPTCNSSRKPSDGISDALINRAMLSAALKDMRVEAPLLYKCCIRRWIKPWSLGLTLQWLNLTNDKYYKRCDWSVEYIHAHVNHDGAKKKVYIRKSKVL